MRSEKKPTTRARALLAWYDAHARALPWRVPPGSKRAPDPYRVWLSEVMLQQTTVAAVGRYYRDFVARWPRVEDLAAAPVEEVMAAWAGLGYYSRARNLHACAKEVAARGGRFPDTEEGLRALPGIGRYTSAAIAAIAFGRSAAVMDANVERVLARHFAVETPLPGAKAELYTLLEAIVPRTRPGDFAQAMMDLGATLCTVKKPACGRCPWAEGCAGLARGIAETLPVKAPKREKPTRRAAAFVLTRADGAVLLRRRPPKGLLGGMMEVPSSPWEEGVYARRHALPHAPLNADWRVLPAPVRHSFTHFHLELEILVAELSAVQAKNMEGRWVPERDLGAEALPTLMRKVLDAGLERAGPLFAR